MTPEQEQVVNDALRDYEWGISVVHKLVLDEKITKEVAVATTKRLLLEMFKRLQPNNLTCGYPGRRLF